MRRLLPLLLLLFAMDASAQDVDFGAFSDAGALLTPVPAARGNAARGAAAPPPPDRLARLRDPLAKAEAPLTKEQEAELNKVLNAEIPAMQQTLRTHGLQLMAARLASAQPDPAAPAAPAPPGATPPTRGAPPSARIPAEVLDALEVESRQMNDALFVKLASSPALSPSQQAVLTKMSRAQIRARGGFDALRVAMEDAGAPFSEEQVPKVKTLFEDQKTTRAALAKESQGTPDPAKLTQLERDTLTKVVGLLVPAQRTALLALLRTQQ